MFEFFQTVIITTRPQAQPSWAGITQSQPSLKLPAALVRKRKLEAPLRPTNQVENAVVYNRL